MKVRNTQTWTVIIVLLTLQPGLAQPESTPVPNRQDAVDALAAKSDALSDDWDTEVFHVHAKHQLERFREQLIAATSGDGSGLEIAELFVPGISIATLRPSGGSSGTYGGFRVRRVTTDVITANSLQRPADAVRSLMVPFRGAGELRFAFKIVRIEPPDEKNFYATTVLYQGYGRNAESVVQQNATWQIRWSPGPDDDHPLIRAVSTERFEEITSSTPLFVECTGAVVGEDDVWREQLLYGGDHWYGKIDAVGEINFLGHEGIAIGDVNGDGLDDVYVAMGTGMPNKLYVQNPDGTARETAAEAGVAWLDATKGVLLVDLDNDGDQDLLCAMGPTIVYCQNDGTGRFTPFRSMRAATNAAFYSLSAADYDLDGDLDIYGCRYVKLRYGLSIPMPFHDANNGPPNHLLRNDGESGFTDVTHDVGLHKNNSRFSLAAAWADYDRDGDPDLYVANDFGRNNLYRNDGGTFVDVAAASGTEDQAAGMGVSWSDIDLDGDFDLMVSNMYSSAGRRISYQPRFKKENDPSLRRQIQHHSLGNALFVNRGDGSFEDAGDASGIRMGRWAWGAKFVDFNNDGYDDLIVPNGFLTNDRKDDL